MGQYDAAAKPPLRIPFEQLMALRRLEGRVSESIATPWSPDSKATFGGHVLAQAAWAATQTVHPDFAVHNVQSLFTLRGLPNRPFRYSVETIRDGKIYCTRAVNVRQPDDTDEDTTFQHQSLVRVEDKYSIVLGGKRLNDHPAAPGIDVPIYWAYQKKSQLGDRSPGVDVRKVDMIDCNGGRPLLHHRQLQYYTPIGPLLEKGLHACIHLYASDRNSLFGIVNGHGLGDSLTAIGSLSHSVIFHAPSEQLTFSNERDREWFCEESWSDVSGHGRALRQSMIWDADGLHVASTFQDGMLKTGKEWLSGGVRSSGLVETWRKSKEAKI